MPATSFSPRESLPAGTFDAQLSFAQHLTEATKQVSKALLLISVPQSRSAEVNLSVRARYGSMRPPLAADAGFRQGRGHAH